LRDIAAGAVRERAQGGLIARDELAKGIAIALAAQFHQPGVVECRRIGYHA